MNWQRKLMQITEVKARACVSIVENHNQASRARIRFRHIRADALHEQVLTLQHWQLRRLIQELLKHTGLIVNKLEVTGTSAMKARSV